MRQIGGRRQRADGELVVGMDDRGNPEMVDAQRHARDTRRDRDEARQDRHLPAKRGVGHEHGGQADLQADHRTRHRRGAEQDAD
ncbi:hypothetical protein HD841_003918 [Sphingomonas melonis]|uniref:Uncharacterized protein n=1 Tax=Sphingomonas melonis TaxID=152682 RepID=A0A7Y9FRY6_9SPHN|nr:hypothetical protein [Sphingomonas melonis]